MTRRREIRKSRRPVQSLPELRRSAKMIRRKCRVRDTTPSPSRTGPPRRRIRASSAVNFDDCNTSELLRRHHRRDDGALGELVSRNIVWIQKRVRRELGRRFRAKLESGDIVNNAVLRVLGDGPRFVIESRLAFRRLMTVIVRNVIRDTGDYFSAQRRALDRDQQLPEDSVLHLDRRREAAEAPHARFDDAELFAATRLALELVSPVARRVWLMKVRGGCGNQEIARELGKTPEAVSKIYERVSALLSEYANDLREGRLTRILDAIERRRRRRRR